MSIVNILHLSDLHFGAGGDETTALAQRKIALEGLLDTINRQDWKPNIVVVSGDIGWKGKKADYALAEKWLNEICSNLHIPQEGIILVPGNHDVDRDETVGMEPPPNAKKADQWLCPNNLRHFEKYFADYIDFCDRMKVPKCLIGDKAFALTGVREFMGIRFVGLNSAWFCRGDEDLQKLWLGLELMKIMQAAGQLEENHKDGLITISVFHHPYEWFNQNERYDYQDRYPSINYICRRSHIVCCGHVHSKSIVPVSTIEDANVIVGGATYEGDNYNNNFAIIQIDSYRKVMRRRTFEFRPGSGSWQINNPENEKSLIISVGNNILTTQFSQVAVGMAEEHRRELHNRPYAYTISFADSYSLLRQSDISFEEREIDELIPGDVNRGIVLHGGGGTGKTEILKRLYLKALKKGLIPIFLDLKKYVIDLDIVGDAKNIETILRFTAPRISSSELEQLINQTSVFILIDAFSEVSGEVREIIARYIRKLIHNGNCYVLIADRLTASWDYGGFKHAKVNYLDQQTIQTEFENNKLGCYDQLDEHLKNIYKSPFFLDLAISTHNAYHDSRVRSKIFEEFFETRLGAINVNELARITFEAINKDGKLDFAYLEKNISTSDIKELQAAGVLQELSFQHHLWIDYLVSRYLSNSPQQWKNPSFDKATIYSSAAFESLMMTIEQLKTDETTDKFIKCIFDWNLTAAVQCIGELCSVGSNKLTSSMSSAIIATTVEKRFDDIFRTRKRACGILQSYQHLDQWRPFVSLDTREKLVEHVNRLHSDSDWFTTWKQLFVGNGDSFKDKVSLIKDEDSLIGWTAANLARRASLSESEQEEIRTIFRQYSKDEEGSIRWRAVHCLGRYQNKGNVDLLFHAITSDPYHWVRYGATRSLIEIASKSDENMRREIITRLPETLASLDFKSEHMRRQILNEAVESAFIKNPASGWKNDALSYLHEVIGLESEEAEKKRLEARVEEFMVYDENE